ncbi:hypothetical protein CPB86DRAFT_783999 [Serendipita vermifera]|nr:hypothetical protein CPB86DRAFT_783999 [Serendipita vermifera]
MKAPWTYVSKALRSQQEQQHSSNGAPKTRGFVDSSTTPLFALLIGINDYKSNEWPDLLGGIQDAMAMQDYLVNYMRIPPSRIRALHGEQATRSAIIHELRSLKNNPGINHGDPILIFFAGHGDATDAPPGWETEDNEIQLLVPFDGDVRGEDGQMTFSIPDRTLGALIQDIAKEKGDNITVVFDCCHSGSLTRGNIVPTYRTRGRRSGVKIPPALDKELLSNTRGAKVPSGFLRTGLSSHIILTACGANEVTTEDDTGRGFFTRALLKALSKVDVNKVTYNDLVRNIPRLPGQNPQCEGHNRDRILFNSMVLTRSRDVYPVKKTGETYVMSAGMAHGVTRGGIFTIYKDRGSLQSSAPLGVLIASDPDVSTTTMVLPAKMAPFEVPKGALAVQTGAGDERQLHVHFEPNAQLDAIAKNVNLTTQLGVGSRYNVAAVGPETADLSVFMENGEIVFTIMDALVRLYGLRRMPYTVPATANDLQRVLSAAAHYYWHFYRTSSQDILAKSIDVEFMKLHEIEVDEWGPVFDPEPEGPNLHENSLIRVVADEQSVYGIRVTNKTDKPLYLSVFYFDHSSLEIISFYESPTSNRIADAPLQPHGSLAIGYGSGGARPYSYVLPDGQDVDVGFLKFFISTEQVDLSGIAQPSPFSEEGQKQWTGGMWRGASKRPSLWHTELIMVVQGRTKEIISNIV